jgi:hypothetical protein
MPIAVQPQHYGHHTFWLEAEGPVRPRASFGSIHADSIPCKAFTNYTVLLSWNLKGDYSWSLHNVEALKLIRIDLIIFHVSGCSYIFA